MRGELDDVLIAKLREHQNLTTGSGSTYLEIGDVDLTEKNSRIIRGLTRWPNDLEDNACRTTRLK
jgi:hypothetical protein